MTLLQSHDDNTINIILVLLLLLLLFKKLLTHATWCTVGTDSRRACDAVCRHCLPSGGGDGSVQRV